jgi:YHS domain-containing protein
MWLRTLLLALLVFFVARAVMRLLSGVRAGVSGGTVKAPRGGQPAVKMMADPVCGTFVVPGKALQAVRAGQTHYFCSEGCRSKWITGQAG